MNEQNKHAALTIAQQYPPAQYNLLVPMQTVTEIADIQKPVMNSVKISTDLNDGEIYEMEKAKDEWRDSKGYVHKATPAKYALTKKGLTKLMRAAGMEEMIMMILSQDGMVAVNSDNVVMFEVKESETLPRETRLCATILITNGARFSRSIGTFRSPNRTELAKLALDYISFSISTGHKCSVQVPTEDEMRNIQGAKSRADAARRGKLDDIIKELLKEDM